MPSKHLESDERVIWAEQPKELKRSKRYITEDMLLSDFDFLWNLIPQKNRKQPIFNDELWDQEWYMVSLKKKTKSNKKILYPFLLLFSKTQNQNQDIKKLI